MTSPVSNVVIYGGNGFVGCALAEQLVTEGVQVYCVSRTGVMPAQYRRLPNAGADSWFRKVYWLPGDAGSPDAELLAKADVVVSTVGSPPLPTFSRAAYNAKVYNNGEVNVLLAQAAQQAGVKRFVLLNAEVPALLRGEWFAYYCGKRQAMNGAEAFANKENSQSFILFPSAIYGARYTRNGVTLRIDWLLRPVAWLQRQLARLLPEAINRYLPSQLVSVQQVATAACDAVMYTGANTEGAVYINNTSISRLPG